MELNTNNLYYVSKRGKNKEILIEKSTLQIKSQRFEKINIIDSKHYIAKNNNKYAIFHINNPEKPIYNNWEIII